MAERKKMGEGDKAIAAYVRANHPEIVERVRVQHLAKFQAIAEHARAKQAAQAQARRAGKAAKLIAELAALGFHVQIPSDVTTTGKVLNGATFYRPAAA